ncbi:cytochrome P450 [Aspergillus glaucus CBS 516.65]|uniref:Cytochrome P450 n=1 Tax=Aspergillus glaucus CBS 516.65 TaxID=1160497 RepID=A0A1L9VN76_ASPGL|nr:hypothetical protein ASPGLDRAFT_66062 [Aspergillus glaucus CBS 516.65]OJJ85332.1 hypothetical protein ASPGLDRAFT_66062 [Aspergillus glaucus CBS 516.65]
MTAISISIISYVLGRIIYNLYLHPLSRYPGPRLAAISSLYYIYWTNNGQLHTKLKDLYDQYGDVVRIEPSSLVYRSAQPWKDIYGHRKSFVKDDKFFTSSPNGPNIQTTFDDAGHARQRRLLLHSFPERALREQESIIQSYIAMLMQRLYEEVASYCEAVDISRWLTYTTFDIIGDLAFGESFDCLRDSDYHPCRNVLVYPLFAFLIAWIIPKSMKAKSDQYYQMSKDKVNRRLATKTNRPDFTSETTSTALSGCIYYLLTNSDVYHQLVNGIRETFRSQDDITILSSAKIPYLYCVLEETLRLYSPVPGIIPQRVPKGGAIIDGNFVPEGVSVSVAFYSAFRARSNFTEAESFIPERWLDNEDPKFASDNRDAFQPFSYGPRNCLGKNMAYAEMRVILAKLLWNFDMELRDECRDWSNQLSYSLWQKTPLMATLNPVEC